MQSTRQSKEMVELKILQKEIGGNEAKNTETETFHKQAKMPLALHVNKTITKRTSEHTMAMPPKP